MILQYLHQATSVHERLALGLQPPLIQERNVELERELRRLGLFPTQNDRVRL